MSLKFPLGDIMGHFGNCPVGDTITIGTDFHSILAKALTDLNKREREENMKRDRIMLDGDDSLADNIRLLQFDVGALLRNIGDEVYNTEKFSSILPLGAYKGLSDEQTDQLELVLAHYAPDGCNGKGEVTCIHKMKDGGGEPVYKVCIHKRGECPVVLEKLPHARKQEPEWPEDYRKYGAFIFKHRSRNYEDLYVRDIFNLNLCKGPIELPGYIHYPFSGHGGVSSQMKMFQKEFPYVATKDYSKEDPNK